MVSYKSMKERPEDERPYEKCLNNGPEKLTDAELLAVIIRTGARGESSVDIAKRILELNTVNKGILGLYHLTVPELLEINGIGTVKAVQLQCVAELSKRMAKAVMPDTASFDSPSAIADYCMEEMRHKEQEELRIFMLNTKNRLLQDIMITKGTVNSSLISPREIFLEALRCHAVYIILVHNHPSGDPTPSKEDALVTMRVKEAGNLLGIQLLDHVIIGDNCYISLKERGVI